MKSLAISQMEVVYGGRLEEGPDGGGDSFWHDVALWICGLWAAGRVFFDVAISLEASPITAAVINGVVDGLCASLGIYELAS